MRKLWSTLALLTVTATLAACGGSDNAFLTPGQQQRPDLRASVAKMAVASSAATLPPDGTTATITVTATDANNVAVAGAAVTFATSAGTLAVTLGDDECHRSGDRHAVRTGRRGGHRHYGDRDVPAACQRQDHRHGRHHAADADADHQRAADLFATARRRRPSRRSLVDANNNVVTGATVNFSADLRRITARQRRRMRRARPS